jgi:nucleoside diphosphate kinase
MFARLRPTLSKCAIASGIALTAYVLNEPTIRAAEDNHIFVINGFYMAMREKYTKPGESIHYYLVEWDPAKLSWEDFRGKTLGATDPATAADGSLRKAIFTGWQGLGLKAEPNVGDNGVHASASPFEALAERLNWCGAKLETDAFGKAMLDSGIPKDTIMAWTKDPQVNFEGKKASLFDLLEDLDYDECLAKAQAIAGVSGKRPSGKMQAFVFLKPHAVTDATKSLVSSKFSSVGVSVYKEGALDAGEIEKNKLIDNHYYAIANKASLSKPKELNPPASKQEEFQKKFGISWKQALSNENVYNAVDGCKRLGIDGVQMDKEWAAAKKAGNLVKFGGGFYAGKLPAPPADDSQGWISSLVLGVFALFGKS